MYPKLLTASGARQVPWGKFGINRNSPQATGLEAWYSPIASRGSDVLRDMSGRGQDMTWSGNLEYVSDPKLGMVANYDGSSFQSVEVALRGAAYPSAVFIWFKTTTSGDYIYSEGTLSYDECMYMHLPSAGRVTWMIYDSVGTSAYIMLFDVNPNPLDGEWHVFGGVSWAEDDHEVFYDGKSIGTSVSVPTGGPFIRSAIGGLRYGPGPFVTGHFNGQIGDVRVYRDNVPTPAQILQMAHPPTMWDLYQPVSRYWPVSVAATGNPWYYYAQQ